MRFFTTFSPSTFQSLDARRNMQGPLRNTLITLGVFYWDQPFSVVWVGWFLRVLLEKIRFWLVWLINFFNQL